MPTHDARGKTFTVASALVTIFAAAARWMVAVRMVSEGVDIPRLAVGVYATSVSTAPVISPGKRLRTARRA
jgi:superfamily II DNA or RNA helicase